MPEFYTWAILLINQLDEIGEKQLSVFGSRGGQICPLMHVPLYKPGLLSNAIHDSENHKMNAKMALSYTCLMRR